MKGQMFFIAAIFMVIGFVLLRGLLTLPEISEEKTFHDTAYLDRNLKNIANEYSHIAGAASMQPSINRSGQEYLYNFSTFVRSEVDSRIAYVLIYANGSTGNFSATIGNFVQNNISGTISFAGPLSSSTGFVMNDRTNLTYAFNSTPGWTNVTFEYTYGGSITIEKFYFNSSRNYVAAFFDITLLENGLFVRSKSYYNRTW